MKFAFSNVAFPTLDFPALAAKARELGYDGVEIRACLGEPVLTAADLFAKDADMVRQSFADSCMQVACIASAISMSGSRATDQRRAESLKRYIDVAQKLGCALVKLHDTQVKPGGSLVAAGEALANWLEPLADFAAERGVTLLIQNALSFRRAQDLWHVLERLNNPSIAVAWDAFSASLVAETPAISVPVLGSRIQYVQIKDGRQADGSVNLCTPGEGDVQLATLLKRLKGIGYGGWVSVDWDRARFPSLPEAQQVLPGVLKSMRQWITPPVNEKKKEPAGEAKKPAAAPPKAAPAAAAKPAAAKPA